MKYPCLDCGALSDKPRCPTHRPKAGHWSAGRDRGKQARFRRGVIKLRGNQCCFIENGQRCPATHRLQAHHTEPGNDDPRTGVMLCPTHHKAVDARAR